MTDKPVMKRKVTIANAIESGRYISFWADEHAANEFAQFGALEPFDNFPNKYSLSVDGRFDFDEVVAYITDFEVAASQ